MKSVLFLLLTALWVSPALAGEDLDRTLCKSATVKAKVKNIRVAAEAIVVRSLEPDATPADWAADLQTALTETVTLAGLCPAKFKEVCPFLEVPTHLEVTVHTAPGLLVQWMLGSHLLDGTNPN